MKETHNNKEKDVFSDQVRRKMEHHTLPVDPALWKNIQHALPARRVRMPLWTSISVAAAALVALLFSLGDFFVGDDAPQFQQTEYVEGRVDTARESTGDDDVPVATEAPALLALQSPVARENIASELRSEDGVEPELLSDEPAEELLLQEAPEGREIARVEEPEDVPAADDKTREKKRPVLKVKEVAPAKDWTDVIRKEKARPVLLAAGAGSGIGGSTASMPGRSRAFRQESLVQVSTSYNNVLTPDDFTHKEYLPPVTAGLSARVPLSERFALESGLTYTFLMTRLSGSSIGDYTADVKLHYLGVPFNMVASLIQNPRWEVYASAGTTVEKGLLSDFKQYEDFGNTLYATEANTTIDGLQWSIGLSLGVSYRVLNQFSVYLDPTLAYYFDNDQPFSIRSVMPLLAEIRGGVRIAL